jgi:TetR/AcrR family transcriptional repressor of mexJK operon
MIEQKPHVVRQAQNDRSASPEETRERIILAARDVIARKGKRGATTREIADAAGVNEATLFRHFGNKEQLIIAVARQACPDMEIRSLIGSLPGPIEEDLYTIARFLNDRLTSMIDFVRWSLVETEYEESIFTKEAWRPQTAVQSAIVDFMAGQVKSGKLVGNPEDLASVLIGIIFARVVAKGKFPNSRIFNDTDYAIRFFIDVFLNGARSK